MKRSRMLMAAGAFILTVAGVAATKANKKFTASASAYAVFGSASYGTFTITHSNPTTNCFTSTQLNNHPTKLTIGTDVYTLVTSTSSSTKAYYF